MPAQIFDLAIDPNETNGLATDSRYTSELAACEVELRAICDPDAIDIRAHADQAAKIEAAGGKGCHPGAWRLRRLARIGRATRLCIID